MSSLNKIESKEHFFARRWFGFNDISIPFEIEIFSVIHFVCLLD